MKLKVNDLQTGKVYKIAITKVEAPDQYGNQVFTCMSEAKQEFQLAMKDTAKLEKAGISLTKLPVVFGIEKKIFESESGARPYLVFTDKANATESTVPLNSNSQKSFKKSYNNNFHSHKDTEQQIRLGRTWNLVWDLVTHKIIKQDEVETMADAILARELAWASKYNNPSSQEKPKETQPEDEFSQDLPF